MKNYRQTAINLLSACFLLGFSWLIFNAVLAQKTSAESQKFRVHSHLQFSKKFSGTGFVLDGDSIRVGKKEVRLFGVDAPEYKQKCLNAKNKEYACGLASRDFLLELAGGKFIECAFSEKDKYDRYLGKCYVDGVSINEELVRNGMAVVYNFTESDPKTDLLEKQAKDKKIGVWQGSFQLPKDYRKQNPRKKKAKNDS